MTPFDGAAAQQNIEKKMDRKNARGATSRRVTIKDVALAAKVSPMTVSNVINRNMQFVSDATRLVVEREIERLGYRVQKTGRNLRRSSQHAIGMLIVDDSPSFLADPFTAHVVAGLSNLLSQHGFSLNIQGTPVGRFDQSSYLRSLEVDGLCVILSGLESQRSQMVEALSRLGQPVVLFQETKDPHHKDFCSIREDDQGGGHMIAEHLLSQGARHFVFLAPIQVWPAMVAREAGVRAALDESKASTTLTVVRSAEDFSSTKDALLRYLETHAIPDAIVGGNDRMALAAMGLMRSLKVDVPAQTRITGFNAFESREYGSPLLTSVISPAYQMGERAARELLARLSSTGFVEPNITLPVTLALGGSS